LAITEDYLLKENKLVKKILVTFLRYLLHFRFIYKWVDSIAYQSQRAIKQYTEAKLQKLLTADGPARILRGPFKGMVYPDGYAMQMEQFQKIIGSYESELHSVVELACKQKYADVVNIGAGEGYYAVGLAMRMSGVAMYAFEMDQQAAESCKQMAAANHVDHQFIFKGECNVDQLALMEFNPNRKGLIICDCEGCELEVLDPKHIPQLMYCDLLVEIHDLSPSGPSSFEMMNSRFTETHTITPINMKSRDPRHFPELETLNALEVETVLSQRRLYSVGWMFLETRSC
jgi:hypothetical protein